MYFHMRKSRTHAMISLATLLACCACTFALDPSLDVSQYAHTSWKVRDGFARGYINPIAQTPDGFLWIGTEFGLVRFDGVEPVPWQPPDNQRLPPGNIFSLLVSRDGTLWIGAKGLASWRNGKLIHYPELADHIIFAIREDQDGTVWVSGLAIPFGNLCAIHNGSVNCSQDNGNLGIGVVALYEDSRGTLWAGVKDGLWQWRPGAPAFHSIRGEPDGIRAIAEDKDGTLLVGWKGGIHRFSNGKIEHAPINPTSHRFTAKRMLRDRNGGLWIGTTDRGLVHMHEGRTDVFTAGDGLSGDTVNCLFEDREGNIWVATTEGLDRFRDAAVSTVTMKQGLSSATVVSVLSNNDGSVWLATNRGLNRWDRGEISVPATGSVKRDGMIEGLPPNSIFRDKRGRLWISTNGVFGYLENGRFSSISGVPGGQVLSIADDTVGNVWVANEHMGLFRISPQNNVFQMPWSVLGHKDHASILAGDRGHAGLWLGFYLGGVAYFSDGQIRASFTTANGLGAGRISDFYFDNDDALWISTENGLSRLKNNHVGTLTSKNGLPCDTVHWSMEGDDHSMWLYTACGLVRIAKADLDRWATAMDQRQGGMLPISVTVLDNSDGVRSLSGAGHYHPQVAKTPDGKMWFLPWDGVSVLDPSHIPSNKLPPSVQIEQIIADRKTYDTGSRGDAGVRLPRLVRDLEIDYTALSLVAPEKNHFRYKLEGLDKEWHEVGNRRQAFYTDLPPRKYRFRVAASNNSGVWNEEGAALDFVIPPAWYQTYWFYALCAAAFLASLWAAYQLRVRQLAHEFNMGLEQRVAERTRVARDLHDTLLQSFQALLPLLQAGINMFGSRPADALRTFKKAADHASQAIAEGRDAIQGMRMSTVEKNDLAVAIRMVGEELASGASKQPAPNFNVVVEGVSRNLHPILRDEVYRLAVEALRNAFRHAVAQNVEVDIRYDEKYFRLRVRDDGKGIPSDVLSGDGREGHYGLPGMRERAKLVGGNLAIWTELDGGTEIELNIPGARAYVKSTRPFWQFGKRSETEPDEKEPIERE